jgi:hypothetical protein
VRPQPGDPTFGRILMTFALGFVPSILSSAAMYEAWLFMCQSEFAWL